MESQVKIGRLLVIAGLLCSISSLLVTAVSAQEIVGQVTDLQTGRALAHVNVAVAGTRLGAASDAGGNFAIARLAPGRYTLVLSHIGYKTVRRQITLEPAERLIVHFELEPKDITAPEVVIEREMLIGNADRIYSIPGSAHYVGPRELEKHRFNDIQRILGEVPGLNIQEEDGFGLRPNIGIRGSGSDRSEKIALMEDGILIAPAPYSAPAAYYFPTAGRMQAVEVRKGSSQIKFGPYTTAGALNLVSTPIPDKLSLQADIMGGGRNARTIHAFLGDARSRFGYLLETFQSEEAGFKRLDGGGDTGFDKNDYMLKLRYNSLRGAPIYHELIVKIGQTDEVSHETYLGLSDVDFARSPLRRYAASREDVMKTRHRQLQIRHFVKFGTALDLTTTIYRNDFRRNWYKLDKVRAAAERPAVGIAALLANPDAYGPEMAIILGATTDYEHALSVKANNRTYYARGVQTILGLRFALWGGFSEVEAGFRYHEDQIDRFQWVDDFRMNDGRMVLSFPGIPGTESNAVGTARAAAGFLQQRLLYGKLTLVPGVRYEHIRLQLDDYGRADPARNGTGLATRENVVSVWIPGAGLDYQFAKKLSAFAGVHRGFSPPGSKAGTRPEKSVNYELGFRYQSHSINMQGAIYYNDYQNLLGADLAAAGGTGSGDQFNGGAAAVKGVELSASVDFSRLADIRAFVLPARLIYSYTDARFRSSFSSEFEPWGVVKRGDELPYVPRHQLTASAGFETSNFRVDAVGRYVSRMRTQAGTGAYIATQSTESHLVLDASVEYTLAHNARLFVGVRNLTNTIYIAARQPAGVRPGLPRTLLAGIKTTL